MCCLPNGVWLTFKNSLMTKNTSAVGPADAQAQGRRAESVAPGKRMVSNPVYEQIKLQLVQQEGVIAALKNRGEQARKDIEKWSGLAKLVPQVEAELAQLNRDYQIVQKGYAEIRQRQESAKLASELETKAQNVQFRIIDPPKLPVQPKRSRSASAVWRRARGRYRGRHRLCLPAEPGQHDLHVDTASPVYLHVAGARKN